MEKDLNDCLQEAMLIASDSYSVPRADIEFADYLNATKCMSQAAYLPQTAIPSAMLTLN